MGFRSRRRAALAVRDEKVCQRWGGWRARTYTCALRWLHDRGVSAAVRVMWDSAPRLCYSWFPGSDVAFDRPAAVGLKHVRTAAAQGAAWHHAAVAAQARGQIISALAAVRAVATEAVARRDGDYGAGDILLPLLGTCLSLTARVRDGARAQPFVRGVKSYCCACPAVVLVCSVPVR